jgi:hypothetical protein
MGLFVQYIAPKQNKTWPKPVITVQLFTSVFAVAEDGSVISLLGLCPYIAAWPPLIPLLCW